jgi:hypothetical protein
MKQLKDERVLEDTFVFCFGEHGGVSPDFRLDSLLRVKTLNVIKLISYINVNLKVNC